MDGVSDMQWLYCLKCGKLLTISPNFYGCRACKIYMHGDAEERSVPAPEPYDSGENRLVTYVPAGGSDDGSGDGGSRSLTQVDTGRVDGLFRAQQLSRLDVDRQRAAVYPPPSPMSGTSQGSITPRGSPVNRTELNSSVSPGGRTLNPKSWFTKKKKQKDSQDVLSDESSSSLPLSDEHSVQKSFLMTIGLTPVFKYEDVRVATDGFSSEIGSGGFGKVFRGKLQDKREVAVKLLYDNNPKQLQEFYNEVITLSRLRHKNLVTLHGCTSPHHTKLLLIYEYVPNGTLAYHLYGHKKVLPWHTRIQIAIETAELLNYLHSAEPPIIHCDVKPSNILLDNDFHVKVADMGMCCLLPWGATHVWTVPQGTMGYRDPEYKEKMKVSNKTDVYSFGVVLLELISSKEAVDVQRGLDDVYLTKIALPMLLNSELEQLVDSKLGYHSDGEIRRMINSVAALACKCLEYEGVNRPPMLEVFNSLKGIRDGTQRIQFPLRNRERSVSAGQENIVPLSHTVGLSGGSVKYSSTEMPENIDFVI